MLVRAIPFPAGRHRVEMRFDPPEVRRGAAVSVLALLVLVALAVVEARRARPTSG